MPKFPKADKRLLGTWKSDKRRTFAEWRWKKNTPPQKKQKLKSFFGKLEITYTPTKIISVLPHRKWEQMRKYSTLAMDNTSVAILHFGKLSALKNDHRFGLDLMDEYWSENKIEHLHFDGKHYWISLGNGKNREFFRKIN